MSEITGLMAEIEDRWLRVFLTVDGKQKRVDLILDENGQIDGQSVMAAIHLLAEGSGLKVPESARSLAMKEMLAAAAGIPPEERR